MRRYHFLKRVITKKFNEDRDDFLKNKGISCFSETQDNILMWSHYAENHKGICVGYHTNNQLFEKSKMIFYFDKLPNLNVYSVFDETNFSDCFKLYCIKNTLWSYEKEWRLFHTNSNTAYRIEKEWLKSIYIGCKTSIDNEKEILSFAKFYPSKINVFKFRKSPSAFSLDAEKIF